MLRWVRKILAFFFPNDPVLRCEVYRDLGCGHVDGPLCDLTDCRIRQSYKRFSEAEDG